MTRWLSIAIVGALLLGGCGGAGSDDDAGGRDADGSGTVGWAEARLIEEPFELEDEPVAGGTVAVGVESDTTTYAPQDYSGTQAGTNVARAVFDPLTAMDSTGTYRPYLAESLTPNDDFTEWTLKLRPNVVFHDGTPLDAAALKNNFDNYLTASGARTLADLSDVASVQVVDDRTLMYVMEHPFASLPAVLAGPAGWPFSPTAAEHLGEDFGSQPVGTGPFKFESWTRDGAFVLERNEEYWQEGLPYLDRLEVRPLPDEQTRALALSSGDVDAIHGVRLSALLADALRMPDVTVYMGRANSASGVIFQTEVPPVDDARIRRSLSYALSQEDLIDVIAGDAAELTERYTQYFGRTSPYYSDAVAEAWPTDDPDEATRLLDEYMNDPERSDGRDVGEPVEIEFNHIAVPSMATLAQAYASMWAAVGYEVEVEPVEQATNIEMALNGDFMASVTRQGGGVDPYIGLENYFGDPEVTPTNYMQYSNERVTEILDELRETRDVEGRAALIEEFGLIMAEDVPNTWTGSNNEFIAAQDEIVGVHSWVFPGDGILGSGANSGYTMWSQVWRAS